MLSSSLLLIYYLLRKYIIEHLQYAGTVSQAGDTTVNKTGEVPAVPANMALLFSCMCV